MRLLHADIQEQHRTASRLSPSTIIELSEGVADAGDDPATIFTKLNELMRKLFHPRLVCVTCKLILTFISLSLQY